MDARRLSLVLVAVFTMATVSLAPAQPASSQEDRDVPAQRNILFLSVDDFTRSYVRLIFDGFTDAVSTAPTPPVIYFEALDASRFERPQYLDDLRDWLHRKYQERPIDLVVTVAEDALGFLADARGEPWPGAQVLYLESGSVSADILSRLPRVGGMLLEDHFTAAVGVAKTILPETRRVALVYGASAIERARWRGFAQRVRDTGLEPIEVVGTSMEQIRDAVEGLPSESVVFVLAPTVDANGNVLTPIDVCELIASTGKVPTFLLEQSSLGCGAVGGLLRNWGVIGRLFGNEALARLESPSTDVVTVPVARQTTLAFDDRQLLRWGIPERNLPSGAVVRFREPSLWRDSRALVLSVAGVTIVQSLLIAGLVFEHRRRRKAEMESRGNLTAMAHLDRRAAMGELATSLAHELNQPLNAILQNAGVAQMLLTSNTVPPALGEMAEIIGDIRKDNLRASEVIRRMRELLQKREMESHPVDFNDVAEDTVALVRPDARSREIEMELALSDGVRPILGDRVHIQQVVLNLLMNAMDAVADMPSERRHVRVSTWQKNGEVRLAVLDRGKGICADRIGEIFEPFYTTKRESTGMGMGLAIARGIIEVHDGRMGAENNAEGGATVWFSVPIATTTEQVRI